MKQSHVIANEVADIQQPADVMQDSEVAVEGEAEDAESVDAEGEDKPKGKILKVVCGLMCIGVIISVVLVALFMSNSADDKPKQDLSLDYLQNNWLVSDKLPAVTSRPENLGRPKPPVEEEDKANSTAGLPPADKVSVTEAGFWDTQPQMTRKQSNDIAFKFALNKACYAHMQLFVKTDKPVYKGGDYIFVSGFAMDPNFKTPVVYRSKEEMVISKVTDPELTLLAIAVVRDYKDDIVYRSNPQWLNNATFSFALKIPYLVSGGPIKISIEKPLIFNELGFEDRFYRNATRKVIIMETLQPKLFITVDNDKKSYVAGETLTAKIKVKRPDAQSLLTGSSIAVKY